MTTTTTMYNINKSQVIPDNSGVSSPGAIQAPIVNIDVDLSKIEDSLDAIANAIIELTRKELTINVSAPDVSVSGPTIEAPNVIVNPPNILANAKIEIPAKMALIIAIIPAFYLIAGYIAIKFVE